MIELHVSSRIDSLLKGLEIPTQIRAKTLEDYIILRKLKLFNIDVLYNADSDKEKLVLRYIELKDNKTFNNEYRELRKIIRSCHDDIIKLMLRELEWKKSYKIIMNKLLNKEDNIFTLLWILSKYHMHSNARELLREVIKRDLDNYSRILILCIILFSIMDLEILNNKFISAKVHDIFYYFRWLLLILENTFMIVFKSCDRIYTLSPPYVITDQAKMTIDEEYTIERIHEHVLKIRNRDYSILVCLTSSNNRVLFRLKYDKVIIKGEDSDFEDSYSYVNIIVPEESFCIVKGLFNIVDLVVL